MNEDPWLRRWAPLFRRGDAASPTLELGCGDGRDTRTLVAFGGWVIAADIALERLLRCARQAPQAQRVLLDLAQPLPFRDRSCGIIVASLSLHYFRWATTVWTVSEIGRCLEPGGTLIARFNSTRDTNYGADSTHEIEPNLYQVGARTKRFFDRPALTRLFKNWQTDTVEEMTIERYEKPKVVWEVVARHGAD